MCGIIDANVAHEVFGHSPSEAGAAFLDRLQSGGGRLVSGGRQLRELEQSNKGYREWARVAISSGVLFILNEQAVKQKERRLSESESLVSDDPHVLALAQLSGARLLYSNDKALQQDFKNKNLIDQPRGKIYTTRESKGLTRTHRSLLRESGLCRHQTL